MYSSKDINNICQQLCSFSAMRSLLEDPVYSTLISLLKSIQHDSGETTESKISKYGAFCQELYFKGGNLSTFIRDSILHGDDAIIQLRLRKMPPSPALVTTLYRELDTLQKVSAITDKDIVQCISTDIQLPDFDTSPVDISGTYSQLLNNLFTRGFGKFAQYSMFKEKNGVLVPVKEPEFQPLESLYGYELERRKVLKNTEALAAGRDACNVLLYGDAGTGKSSTVKACAAAFFDKGVRLIEISKNRVSQIPDIVDALQYNPLKFIFFIDDLTFDSNDDDYNALKGILEGNVSGRSNNMVLYATSNRRHLVKETSEERMGTDLHLNDTLQETMSLSARFGLTITFQKPEKDLYLEIVKQLADERGLAYDSEEELFRKAEAFAIRANGRSPRTAKQFIILSSIGI